MLTIEDNICLKNKPVKFQINIYGNSNVGKSSLIQKYIHNLDTSSSNLIVYANLNADMMARKNKYNIESTLVVTNMRLYSPNSSNLVLNIFDPQVFPGNNKKFSHFRFSDAVILMYDVTDLQSFNDIKEDYNKILSYVSPKIPFVLVGNKTDTDLDFIEDRKVSFEEGEKFANSNDMCFFETSVFFNKNVNELFGSIIKSLLRKEREFRKKQKKNTDKIEENETNFQELCLRRRHMCVLS
jgi:small GTP-binding protein